MSQSQVVSVRMSETERDLLESAAALARTNLSEFIRRKAIEAAELEVLAQTAVRITPTDWERFEGWMRSPAKHVPGFAELATRKPIWED